MLPEERVYKVLTGFSNLNMDERRLCIERLNEFVNAEKYNQNALKEDFKKKSRFSLGPLDSGGCPCCGK